MEPTLKQQLLGLRIVHAALFAPLAIYGAIVFVAMGPAARRMDPDLVAGVAGGIALVILVGVIPYLRRTMMPERRSGGDVVSLDGPLDEQVTKSLNKLRVASILTWAFAESIAMFGLVVAFLTGKPVYYLPFAGVSAVGLAIYAPTRAGFESVIRAVR